MNTEIALIKHNYSFYMPLSQAAKIFGGELSWDAETKVAVWSVNGRNIAIFAGDNIPDAFYYYYDYYYYNDMYGYMPEFLDDEFLDDELFKPYSKYFGSDYSITYGVIINDSVFIDLDRVEYYTKVDFGFDDKTGEVLVR